MTRGGRQGIARRRCLAVIAWSQLLVLGAGVAGCASESGSGRATSVQPRAGGFFSNGRPVRIEEVRSQGQQPRPAVIMLHGASGVGRGWLIYPYADAIARRGISAFIIHYFDGLSPAASNPSGTAHFATRDRIVDDAIRHVGSLPETDSRRIGLFGLSLGGFHALGRAAGDARIAAVVDLMGAMPRSVPEGAVRRMPPTLILHGARDTVVPVERAADLALLLGRVNAPFEMKIYRNEGHTMTGGSHGNSVELTAEFLDRHLGGPAAGRD